MEQAPDDRDDLFENRYEASKAEVARMLKALYLEVSPEIVQDIYRAVKKSWDAAEDLM